MRFSSVGVGLAVLFGVTMTMAAQPPTTTKATTTTTTAAKKSNPDTCRDAFSCGAMSARLAGSEDDYPGAFRAIRRGCDIETRAPIEGDSLFACEQYAELLISAGTARGGDPPKGLSMLEEMCKKRPVSTPGDVSPCSTLAREYDKPPKASGLPRQTDKAAALQSKACDQGDALACASLGDMYLKGGPSFPADLTKARASMDRGCAGSDHYAAGVCGSIGSMLADGKLNQGTPDRKAAMPYLTKSCAQGYRCDLLVEFLLRDGKNDEAIRAFDGVRNFFMGEEWAEKYCKEGFKVMCGHTRPAKIAASTTSAAKPGSATEPGY